MYIQVPPFIYPLSPSKIILRTVLEIRLFAIDFKFYQNKKKQKKIKFFSKVLFLFTGVNIFRQASHFKRLFSNKPLIITSFSKL